MKASHRVSVRRVAVPVR